MFVEKMQFPMPVAGGFPTHADKAEAAFSVQAIDKAKAEEEAAAVLKAKAEEEAAAFLKAKMEEEVAAFVKAKAEEEAAAEEEASFILKAKPEEGMVKAGCGSKRKAEEDREEEEAAEDDSEEEEDEDENGEEMAKAKEAGFLKAKAFEEVMKASFEWDYDEVPYDKVCHESDAEEDMETFMARIEARWDVFIKEEEARFPGLTYRVDLPGEYSIDDPDDSDTEEEYYRRKLEREKAVNVVV